MNVNVQYLPKRYLTYLVIMQVTINYFNNWIGFKRTCIFESRQPNVNNLLPLQEPSSSLYILVRPGHRISKHASSIKQEEHNYELIHSIVSVSNHFAVDIFKLTIQAKECVHTCPALLNLCPDRIIWKAYFLTMGSFILMKQWAACSNNSALRRSESCYGNIHLQTLLCCHVIDSIGVHNFIFCLKEGYKHFLTSLVILISCMAASAYIVLLFSASVLKRVALVANCGALHVLR